MPWNGRPACAFSSRCHAVCSYCYTFPTRLQVEQHGQALPPGPGREMTFEEKRRLSHSMGTLAGEKLVHVLQIISEGPSAPVLVSWVVAAAVNCKVVAGC